MAKKKKLGLIIKNKQEKFLPFLQFEKVVDYTKKYKIRTEEQKQLEKENKAKRKAKRKKLFSIISFVLNMAILAIILIVQLAGNDPSSVYAPFINWKYIAILAAIVVAIILIETLKLMILIKKSTKKTRPFLAYKTAALGKYYDNLTPMSTGGQPFQMLYMNKRGIRGDIATGIPLMRYITWQISYVIICSAVLIYNGIVYGSTTDPFTTTVAWVAVIINIVIFSSIILLSVSKRFGPKIVIGILKLLSKMHIVKNYQKTFRKVMRFVVNYQKTFKTLASNPIVLISEIFLASADIFVNNIIPFFICYAFVPIATIEAQGITFFTTFIQSVICGLTLGFIPTPGAGGGAEAMFVIIFGTIFQGKTFWPVLTWRIITYYVFLLQGLLVLVYDFVIGNRRYEKLKAQVLADDVKKLPTFRETLAENRKTISVVQNQEEDKLAKQMFTGLDKYDDYGADEIIKNSDLVSNEEMNKKVYPAEQMLMEMRLKDLNKRKEKNQRKIYKKSSVKKIKFKRVEKHKQE